MEYALSHGLGMLYVCWDLSGLPLCFFLSLDYKLWIGLNDLNEDSIWTWFIESDIPASFTNWAPGQTHFDGENCVLIREDGDRLYWHDYPCDHKYRSVCEYRWI
jgi:hypothetical protein